MCVCTCVYVCIHEYKACEIASDFSLMWFRVQNEMHFLHLIMLPLTLSLPLVHSFHLTHYWAMLCAPVVYTWNPSPFSILVASNKLILLLSRSFSLVASSFGYLLLFPPAWLAPVGSGLIGRWFGFDYGCAVTGSDREFYSFSFCTCVRHVPKQIPIQHR